MSHRLIVIGRAAKPFGVKGEISIAPFTESFEAFENSEFLIFDDAPKRLRGIRIHKGHVLASLVGVTTPESAKELAGCFVKTDVRNLPLKGDDEYYWYELMGMHVSTVDGRYLGTIVAITPTGANEVLHVEGAYGEVLLPMIEDVVVEVDTEKNAMIVDPLEGLIPDD